MENTYMYVEMQVNGKMKMSSTVIRKNGHLALLQAANQHRDFLLTTN